MPNNALAKCRFDLEPHVGRTFRPLPRRVFAALDCRSDKANRLERIRLHLWNGFHRLARRNCTYPRANTCRRVGRSAASGIACPRADVEWACPPRESCHSSHIRCPVNLLPCFAHIARSPRVNSLLPSSLLPSTSTSHALHSYFLSTPVRSFFFLLPSYFLRSVCPSIIRPQLDRPRPKIHVLQLGRIEIPNGVKRCRPMRSDRQIRLIIGEKVQ